MSSKRVQSAHNGTAITGRPIRVPRGALTVRTLLRRHLREEKVRMQDLAGPWNCSKGNVYDIFWASRPLSPQHIEAAAKALKLDAFDTARLILQGAREAGWKIDLKHLIHEDPQITPKETPQC